MMAQIIISLTKSVGVARTDQYAGIVTQIKGKLLNRVMVIINCVPFQEGTSLERKELAPRGSELFPLRAVPFC